MIKNLSKSKVNFLYNSFYQILLIVIPLITTPYISRVLNAEKIGLYSYTHAVAYYFVIFIMLGLNNYGNRSVAFVRDNKNKLSNLFWGIYYMQLILSIFIITIYIVYTLLFSNNIMTWLMLIYVISGMLDINWFYFGIEQFKLTVIRNSLIKIISTILIFLLVKKQSDIIIYTLINVIGILMSQVILWYYLPRFIEYKKVKKEEIVKHIKPNLMLFIPVIAISIYKIMDKIMLGTFSDLSQVGYYENTEKIIQVPIALINSLGTIMMPKISNLVANKNETTIKKYLEKSLVFAVYISSLLCFGIMAVSTDFVPIYYGKGFETCIILFKILMPSCIFLAIANVIRTQFLIPYKYDKIYIISVIGGAIVNFILNAILISKYGSVGAAFGTLAAEFSVCTLQILLIKKEYNFYKKIIKLSKYVFIGFIMFLIIKHIPNYSNNNIINLVIKTISGGLIYLLGTLYFVKKELFQNSDGI